MVDPAAAPVKGREPRSGAARLNKEIANAAVRLHKRFLGRGPTRAQAFFRDNIVVVVMQDTLTEAERSLAADCEEPVLQMRLRFQETMRAELEREIGALTGCRVEAFMSGNHIEPDVAAQVFVLDRPVPGEPADRAAA